MRSLRFGRVLVCLAVVVAVVVPVALAFGFDDGVNPPGGTVGTPYSFQFKGRNGCPPYSFVLASGGLPPGLSMDSGGTIRGTPTTAGSFGFWVELRDTGCGTTGTCPPAGVSCSAPSQRPFTIDIADKLTVQNGVLSPGTVGVAYAVKLTATGGGSLTWSVSAGVLPAGLTLAVDGTLSGTPTAATAAPVTFVVRVTDGTRVDSKSLSLDIVSPLAVTQPTLAAAEIGHALKPTTLVATGGRAPYVWALVGAPAWLTLDPASGLLNGTPTDAGSFPLPVSVKDVYGTTTTLTLVVLVKAKVTVATLKLPVSKVGKLYKATLRTAAGVAPFTWKVTSGKFPVGIRLDRTLGVLGGSPRQAGTFPLQFTVTDALGETADVSLTLTVNALPKKKKK
jgi:large repetitive protein